MRRWNGWGDEGVAATVPADALRLLEAEIGPADGPAADATLDAVVAASPRIEPRRTSTSSRPIPRTGSATPAARACPTGSPCEAAGSGRSGRGRAIRAATTEVRGAARLRREGRRPGHPLRRRDERRRRRHAGSRRRSPDAHDRDGRLAGLRHLDERSGLATFGAGTVRAGPRVDARAARPDARPLPPVIRALDGRRLGRDPVGRPASRSASGGSRTCSPAAASKRPLERSTCRRIPRRRPARISASSCSARRAGSAILTTATVRTVAQPEREAFPAWFLPDWPHALEAARRSRSARTAAVDGPRIDAARDRDAPRPRPAARARLRSSSATFASGGSGRSRRSCSLARAARSGSSRPRSARSAPSRGAGRDRRRRVDRAALDRQPIPDAGPARRALGGRLRRRHARDRDRLVAPAGSRRRTSAGRSATASTRATSASTRSATCRTSTRAARACTSTYVFRRAPDPDETLARWGSLKDAASAAIVRAGGTISHQHGVGRDHARYLRGREGRARDGGAR